MIPLVWLKGHLSKWQLIASFSDRKLCFEKFRHLLLGFHLLCLHLLHLTGEHSLRLCGRVDAVRLWTEEGLPIEKFWQHSVYQNKKFIGSDQS